MRAARRWPASCRPGRASGSPAAAGGRGAGAAAAGGRAARRARRCRPSALETLVLPARLAGYSPALLDELTAAGEVTWTGCGALAGGRRLAGARAGRRGGPAAPRAGPRPRGHAAAPRPAHRAGSAGPRPGGVRPRVGRGRGRSGVRRRRAVLPGAGRPGRRLCRRGEPTPGDDAVVAAIWDLAWAGLLTNDTLAPLRARLGGGRGGSGGAHRTRRRGTARPLRAAAGRAPGDAQPVGTAVGGRAVGGGPGPRAGPDAPRARAAEAFLERHGVLTRGALATERVAGGFAAVYRVLRAMEDSGRCRRGYIVDGLGAAQFAVPGAIDRVRAMSRPDGPESGGFGPDEAAGFGPGGPTGGGGASRCAGRVRPRPGRAGGGSAGRRTGRRAWCSPPRTRPSPTAPRCRGRTRWASPGTAPRGRPARWWCWSTAHRCCTSSGAGGRCSRSPPSRAAARRGGGAGRGRARGLARAARGGARRRGRLAGLGAGGRPDGGGVPGHAQGAAAAGVAGRADERAVRSGQAGRRGRARRAPARPGRRRALRPRPV